MTTVILADDHEIVRRGVRSVLQADGRFNVVAETADGLSAVQLAEKHKPHLMFLDLSLTRLHGLEALRQAGHDIPSSCEQGFCGTCETRVLDGVPDHRDALLTEKEREACSVMMPCVSRARTPTLTLDI